MMQCLKISYQRRLYETAFTIGLGLIPLLWESPVGKELKRPLAQALLGGLFTSTLLNIWG